MLDRRDMAFLERRLAAAYQRLEALGGSPLYLSGGRRGPARAIRATDALARARQLEPSARGDDHRFERFVERVAHHAHAPTSRPSSDAVAERDRAIIEYHEGDHAAEVAEIVGVSKQTVRNVRKRHGRDPLYGSGPRRP